MNRDVFAVKACPLGETCRAEDRPCGVLRVLPGVDIRMVGLNRGERMKTDCGDLAAVRTVHSGLAAVCTVLGDGRRQLLCLAGPGEALCAVLPAGIACWVEALAPSVVCEIRVAADQLSAEQRAQAHCVMGELARARLESAFAHVVSLGRLDGTERVAAFLASMARRIGRPDDGAWRIPVLMTREDIADHLGLNADTVSRILRRLKAEGLVLGRGKSELVLPDLAALEARAPCLVADMPATAQGEPRRPLPAA